MVKGGEGWSGDLLLADCEHITNVEHVSDIYIKRFRAQGMLVSR